jgi:filamentous hemagglutinin family protein
MLLATSALVASPVIVSTAAMANPAGGSVAVGSATITNPSATQTVINQSSKRALINWNSFSVQPGASVTFNQPNSKSLTVNRVTGPGSSTIDGSIFANGNIWLLNANGILFGKGSQINVGSILATTSELSDSDFAAGNNNFTASPNPNASVVNQGTITASRGGSVVLSAPSVSNEGMIQADLGTVVLGGAQAFTVDMTGDNLLRYEISAPVTQTPADAQGKPALALVSNSGTISAAGGHVVMTARAAQNVEDNVINNTGMVEATSVSVHNGEVDIDAGPDGTANVGGAIDVSGSGSGQTGGTVTVAGGMVNVADGAKINASGNAGGGTVLIGGGPHGTGTLAHAQRTIIGAGATINADATGNGNGGNVTVWSDGTTQFDGAISSRGGALGGNGGQVETSGHNLGVGASAKVDTSAPLGLTGDWLLDPANIAVTSSGGEGPGSTNNCVTISNGTIDTALGTSNVTLEASSNINVSTNASIAWSSDNALSLLSEGNISIRSSIQSTGNGALNIVAGWDGTTGVSGSYNGSQVVNVTAITANGAYGGSCGSISITPGTTISIGTASGQTTIAGDDITLSGNGSSQIQIGHSGAGGGNIVIDAKGNLTLSGAGTNNIFLLGNGAIFSCVTSPVTGDVTLNVGGNLTVNASNNTVDIGNGDIGASVCSTVAGDVNIDVGSVTTLNDSNGTLTIGLNSGTSRSGDVTVVTGSLSETGYALETNLYDDLAGGNVVFGQNSDYVFAAGAVVLDSTHDLSILSKGNITFLNSLANNGTGNMTLVAGWNGTTSTSQLTNAGAYGNNDGSVTLVAGVTFGSAQGTTTVAGYDVELGQGSIGTERIGYADAGTGNINVLAADSLYFVSNGTGIIGNGLGSGTVRGNITLDIANTIAYGSNATIEIGNSGGAGTTSGDLSITAGTLILPNVNSIVETDIGYGDVSIELTGQTSTSFGALSYNSANNLSIVSTGNLTLTDAITNCGTGSISVAAGGTQTNTAGNLTIAGAVTTGGSSGVGDVFQAGDSITISNAMDAGAGVLILWAGQQEGDNHAGAILDPVGNLLTADTIYLRNDKGGTSDQTIGTSSAPIYVATNHLAISTASDDVYVGAIGNVDIGDGFYGINGNNVTLTATGNITQDTSDSLGISASTLTVNVTGTGHDIALTDGGGVGDNGNEITGAVNLGSASGNVSFTNTATTTLGSIQADGIFNIVVTDANQDAGDNGHAQLLVDGAVTANGAGNATLHATGNIVDADAYTITADALNMLSDDGSIGTSTFIPININSLHAVTGATGGVLLSGNKSFIIGISGDGVGLNIGSGGGYVGAATGTMTQMEGADGKIVGSNLAFGATSGYTLNNTGNTVGGNLTLYAGQGQSNSFTNSDATELGGISQDLFNTTTVGGNITLTVLNGPLTQSGAIYADNLTIDASNGYDGSPPITLTNSANDVTGTFSVTTPGDVSFTNNGTITLGSVNDGPDGEGGYYASGDVTLTALAGGITVTDGILSRNESTITLTAPGNITQAHNSGLDGWNFIVNSTAGNITLLSSDNELSGTVNISASGDVAFGNNDNTTLGATSVGGNLSVLSEGNLNVTSNIANSDSGNIQLVAGWDGTSAPANITANATSTWGGEGHDVLINANYTTGDVTVGSAQGTTSIYGNNVTVFAAEGRFAQLGYTPGGNGTINVYAGHDISVLSSSEDANSVAIIGNGNPSASGDVGGNITLNAGNNVTLQAYEGTFAAIGNYGSGSSVSGEINITAGGNISLTAGDICFEDCYFRERTGAAIGNDDLSGTGAVGGNITLNAGQDVLLTGEGEYASVGNVGEGTVSGAINVTAGGNVSLKAGVFGEGSGSVIIGNSGYGGDGVTTVSGDITVTANGTVELNTGGEGFGSAYAQIGNYGSEYGNGTLTVGGNVSVTANGTGGIALNTGLDGYTLIGDLGEGGSATGDTTVIASNGGVSLTGSNSDSDTQIGNYGDTSASGNVTVEANGGDLTLNVTASNGDVQIGNGSYDANGSVSGNVTVSTSGNLSIIAAQEGASAQIGNGYAQHNDQSEASASGNINVTAMGNITIHAAGENAYAVIGNGDSASVGAVSGNITLNGGDVTLSSSEGALAEIGNTGDGPSVNGTINITAGGNVSLSVTSESGELGGERYGSLIGNYNAGTGTTAGNIVVNATNVYLYGESGAVGIGNDGDGTMVSGAINITAAGNIVLSSAESGSAWIGNQGRNDNITVGGDISVTANGTDGVTVKTGEGGEFARIGNYVQGDGTQVSGNVTVTANNGGVVVSAFGDYSDAQIGNTGTGDIDPDISGDINVAAKGGDLDVKAMGEGATAQIGNSGHAGGGTMGGNINVTATGNISVSGVVDNAYALIGNGDLSGYSTGSVSGDITLKAGGILQFDSENGGKPWLGNIRGTGEGDIESGNLTVVVSHVNDSENTSFDQMVEAALGATDEAGSGGDVFVGVSDDVEIGGINYDSPHTLSVASQGSLDFTGNIQNSGSGAVNVVAGWDGQTYNPSSLGSTGAYGNNSGNVTLDGAGESGALVGSYGGTTLVEGHDINLDPGAGPAQIGYHGADGSGAVTVQASGNITLAADVAQNCGEDSCNESYAQIGNGGVFSDGADSGLVTVQAAGNISLHAGAGTYDYAQIGNGGDTGAENDSGDVSVVAGGALTLTGGVDYAQIGNGGYGANSASGNITVQAQNISLNSAPSGPWGYAQIGNGGWYGSGDFSGNINVAANGAIAMTAGENGQYAQIGNGADLLYGNGNSSGDVTIHAAALTLTGASDAATSDDYVEIGNTANYGTASGNIAITLSGNATINTAEGGGDVWIGNRAEPTGTSSGSVTLLAAGFDTDDDDNNDTGKFFSADLQDGAMTLGFTSASSQENFGGLDYSSAYDLTLLTAGNLEVQGDLQNAGTGNITVVTGWNPAVAPANVSATAGAYGNNGGTLTIGGSEGGGFASLGSAGGTTNVLTGGLVVDAYNGGAQLGYRGDGTGAINVSALGDVAVQTDSSNVAQIGNGGLSANGAVSGDISIDAGTVEVTSFAQNSIAQIGNIGGAGSSQSGNITVNAFGVSIVAVASDATVQIGNSEDGDGDPGVYGNASGNIQINAHFVALGTYAGNDSAMVGNGSELGYNSNTIGNVDVSAVEADLDGEGVDNGDSDSEARIGNRGRNSTGGDITVNLTGPLQMDAASAGNAIIGSHSAGTTSGNVTVVSGSTITAEDDSADSEVFIGHSGEIASGDVSVTANGDITLNANGTNTLAAIGDAGTGTFSGNVSVTSLHGNVSAIGAGEGSFAGVGLITESGVASATGAVNVAGTNVNLIASGDDALVNIGMLSEGGNASGNVTVTASQNLTLSSSEGGLADIGPLPFGGAADGTVNVTANAMSVSGTAQVSGDAANIVVTGAGQNVGSASAPLLLAVGSLALETNNGSAYLSSPAQGLSIGAGADGIDLGTGSLNLSADGDITQTAAIDAASVNVSTSGGNITLGNSGNTFDTASLTSSGNAALTDSTGLTVSGANVTGNLTLTARSVSQSGAIDAGVLTATASNGGILLANTGNAIGVVSIASSADTSLTDSTALTVAGATVGSNLTLTAASFNQTGAINAANFAASASNGSIALTNAGNTITNAALTSSGGASLTDSGNLTVTRASVGGNLTLAAGSISQSGAIHAAGLTATASNGSVALTNTGNNVTAASLSSSGDASLYDVAGLTLNGAAVGGNLTVLTKGNLVFASSAQLTNGSLLAVAGWDGTTTSPSALTSGSAYGNNGSDITIGGSGGVAVGSQSGSTTLAADDLLLSAINGYAQVGYHGGGSGAITVNATGNVTLNGGANIAYFAQIGDGGYQVSGSNSGAVRVLANGNVTLHAGSGQEAYAQIGNGGAESNSSASGYTNTGAVTVDGKTIALNAGSGSASYAQIGDGGYKSGQSLNGVARLGGDIVLAAVSGVSLNGNAADAYAQIGNGGDFVNTGSANGSSGTISGNITVGVSSPATAGNAVVGIAGTGANSYVQIGNGGNGENTTGTGNTVTYNISGNITVNDLVLTGSNTGANGYAQVGNGDGAHSGTGNVSGNIAISQGTVFDLTPGTASGTSTGIQNSTGSGSVSGAISGYTAPSTTTPTSDPTTAGSVSTIIQNNNSPTSFTYTATSAAPSFAGTTSDFTAGGGVSSAPTPLEKLAGDAEDENVPSDGVANSVGDSLNGGGKSHVVSKTIIPGVLDEIITLTPTHPHGVPPADEDYSSWGNEALWRW